MSGKKRIGGYRVLQDDELAVTYVLDPTIRWIYFALILSWGVAAITLSNVVFVSAGVATAAYFVLVWWPSRPVWHQIRVAARGGWIQVKGSPLSHSNPATYRIQKTQQVSSDVA